MDDKTSGSGITSINKDPRSDMHSTIDKLADKVPAVTDKLATTAHAGVDKVADTIDSTTEKWGSKAKDLGVSYKRFAESSKSYVRTSPVTSVLVALAAGYAVSKLLGSRKH